MAKRKLNLQQQRRVDRRHRPGKAAAQVSGAGEIGTVMARYGKQADVIPGETPAGDGAIRCHIRANVQDVVAGDRVLWQGAETDGVITALLPRESLMSRPDNRGRLKPLAANVSQIAIVIAPEPRPHQNLVDRYLVAVEQLGIKPLLVVNKVDLSTDPEAGLGDLVPLYRELGYRVLEVSASTGAGVSSLLTALERESTAFVGQSGVGKSSLINRACPAAGAETGSLSQIAKGKHTTTAARLYPLESGGCIIDSPGIREFGLWHLESDQVAEGFIEFRPYLGHCRFRNCLHLGDTGCALARARDQGEIPPRRLASYRQIVHDLGSN